MVRQTNLNLKAMIIKRYGTETDFAVKLGTFPTIVSQVVRGTRALSIEEKEKWARYLECEPAEIFGGESAKPTSGFFASK